MARAVAESFFNLLKRELIRLRTYKTREEARQDVFPSRASRLAFCDVQVRH